MGRRRDQEVIDAAEGRHLDDQGNRIRMYPNGRVVDQYGQQTNYDLSDPYERRAFIELGRRTQDNYDYSYNSSTRRENPIGNLLEGGAAIGGGGRIGRDTYVGGIAGAGRIVGGIVNQFLGGDDGPSQDYRTQQNLAIIERARRDEARAQALQERARQQIYGEGDMGVVTGRARAQFNGAANETIEQGLARGRREFLQGPDPAIQAGVDAGIAEFKAAARNAFKPGN